MSSAWYSCCSSAYIFTKKTTPSEKNFNNYSKILISPIQYRRTTREAYLEPAKHPQWSFFTKIFNVLKPLTIFAKTLHPRCLTGFWIHLWPLKEFYRNVNTCDKFAIFNNLTLSQSNTMSLVIYVTGDNFYWQTCWNTKKTGFH